MADLSLPYRNARYVAENDLDGHVTKEGFHLWHEAYIAKYFYLQLLHEVFRYVSSAEPYKTMDSHRGQEFWLLKTLDCAAINS